MILGSTLFCRKIKEEGFSVFKGAFVEEIARVECEVSVESW